MASVPDEYRSLKKKKKKKGRESRGPFPKRFVHALSICNTPESITTSCRDLLLESKLDPYSIIVYV